MQTVWRVLAIYGCALVASTMGQDRSGDPQRGYEFLTEKVYLPADFDQETFDSVWRTWPEPDRSRAEKASAEERRRMAMRRYGLTPRPDDASGRPLQYVVDAAGRWSMNCFSCHGGAIEGRVVPGLPNSNYALELLTAEIRETKLRLGKSLGHMDLGSLVMPLGRTRGTTNAVMFGVALLAYRDPDLTLRRTRIPPRMVHHDMDAPPWWHFRLKRSLYIDGFAPKGHRALMQFMLVEQNGPEEFNDWEADFVDVFAYLSSLKAPRYPGKIDSQLASEGQQVFANHCAQCHGSYGPQIDYPERVIPWEDIRTDRVRLDSLSAKHRQTYARSWFNLAGEADVALNPTGYVAPPLTGIWASAPYLHNGSVPTLWHLLRPSARPEVWTRQSAAYDHDHMGLDVVTSDDLPGELANHERFEYFDTRRHGKAATGHDFPAALTEVEKRTVLEYLKTL